MSDPITTARFLGIPDKIVQYGIVSAISIGLTFTAMKLFFKASNEQALIKSDIVRLENKMDLIISNQANDKQFKDTLIRDVNNMSLVIQREGQTNFELYGNIIKEIRASQSLMTLYEQKLKYVQELHNDYLPHITSKKK